MDWKNNINTIKEIFSGHFQIILDFATIDFLKFALSDEYKYVWVYSHNTNNSLEWDYYNLPLYNNKDNYKVIARQIKFDFIMETVDFKDVLPNLGPGISLCQLNTLPKYYLDLNRIKGKARYDLLQKECDYLFDIDIPSATDYGTLVSSKQHYLQSVLDNKNINWQNLP